MKKQILVPLLILNSVFAYAMEDKSSFLNYFSLNLLIPTWFSSHQIPDESQIYKDSILISGYRTGKDNFENQLRDKEVESILEADGIMTTEPVNIFNIHRQFLLYCYYFKFHKDKVNVQLLGSDTIRLCRGAQLDGYSGLGAVMLARDMSLHARYNCVQQLINLDFCPTPKDREIAELILYDEIMKNKQESQFKKKLIHLLHPDSPAYWRELPQEIRKLIAQYLVEVIKTDNNYWLLTDGKKDVVAMY
jgi:hypothetical protein